ncbi:hypothetical protein HY990_07465 [Candidatus Micrarchaeota archaeon]|nr:hypothetical protein [Candidatus Micrarchaeota archaeon]
MQVVRTRPTGLKDANQTDDHDLSARGAKGVFSGAAHAVAKYAGIAAVAAVALALIGKPSEADANPRTGVLMVNRQIDQSPEDKNRRGVTSGSMFAQVPHRTPPNQQLQTDMQNYEQTANIERIRGDLRGASAFGVAPGPIQALDTQGGVLSDTTRLLFLNIYQLGKILSGSGSSVTGGDSERIRRVYAGLTTEDRTNLDSLRRLAADQHGSQATEAQRSAYNRLVQLVAAEFLGTSNAPATITRTGTGPANQAAVLLTTAEGGARIITTSSAAQFNAQQGDAAATELFGGVAPGTVRPPTPAPPTAAPVQEQTPQPQQGQQNVQAPPQAVALTQQQLRGLEAGALSATIDRLRANTARTAVQNTDFANLQTEANRRVCIIELERMQTEANRLPEGASRTRYTGEITRRLGILNGTDDTQIAREANPQNVAQLGRQVARDRALQILDAQTARLNSSEAANMTAEAKEAIRTAIRNNRLAIANDVTRNRPGVIPATDDAVGRAITYANGFEGDSGTLTVAIAEANRTAQTRPAAQVTPVAQLREELEALKRVGATRTVATARLRELRGIGENPNSQQQTAMQRAETFIWAQYTAAAQRAASVNQFNGRPYYTRAPTTGPRSTRVARTEIEYERAAALLANLRTPTVPATQQQLARQVAALVPSAMRLGEEERPTSRVEGSGSTTRTVYQGGTGPMNRMLGILEEAQAALARGDAAAAQSAITAARELYSSAQGEQQALHARLRAARDRVSRVLGVLVPPETTAASVPARNRVRVTPAGVVTVPRGVTGLGLPTQAELDALRVGSTDPRRAALGTSIGSGVEVAYRTGTDIQRRIAAYDQTPARGHGRNRVPAADRPDLVAAAVEAAEREAELYESTILGAVDLRRLATREMTSAPNARAATEQYLFFMYRLGQTVDAVATRGRTSRYIVDRSQVSGTGPNAFLRTVLISTSSRTMPRVAASADPATALIGAFARADPRTVSGRNIGQVSGRQILQVGAFDALTVQLDQTVAMNRTSSGAGFTQLRVDAGQQDALADMATLTAGAEMTARRFEQERPASASSDLDYRLSQARQNLELVAGAPVLGGDGGVAGGMVSTPISHIRDPTRRAVLQNAEAEARGLLEMARDWNSHVQTDDTLRRYDTEHRTRIARALQEMAQALQRLTILAIALDNASALNPGVSAQELQARTEDATRIFNAAANEYRRLFGNINRIPEINAELPSSMAQRGLARVAPALIRLTRISEPALEVQENAVIATRGRANHTEHMERGHIAEIAAMRGFLTDQAGPVIAARLIALAQGSASERQAAREQRTSTGGTFTTAEIPAVPAISLARLTAAIDDRDAELHPQTGRVPTRPTDDRFAAEQARLARLARFGLAREEEAATMRTQTDGVAGTYGTGNDDQYRERINARMVERLDNLGIGPLRNQLGRNFRDHPLSELARISETQPIPQIVINEVRNALVDQTFEAAVEAVDRALAASTDPAVLGARQRVIEALRQNKAAILADQLRPTGIIGQFLGGATIPEAARETTRAALLANDPIRYRAMSDPEVAARVTAYIRDIVFSVRVAQETIAMNDDPQIGGAMRRPGTHQMNLTYTPEDLLERTEDPLRVLSAVPDNIARSVIRLVLPEPPRVVLPDYGRVWVSEPETLSNGAQRFRANLPAAADPARTITDFAAYDVVRINGENYLVGIDPNQYMNEVPAQRRAAFVVLDNVEVSLTDSSGRLVTRTFAHAAVSPEVLRRVSQRTNPSETIRVQESEFVSAMTSDANGRPSIPVTVPIGGVNYYETRYHERMRTRIGEHTIDVTGLRDGFVIAIPTYGNQQVIQAVQAQQERDR